MSSRRQISNPLGGRYRQVSLYIIDIISVTTHHFSTAEFTIDTPRFVDEVTHGELFCEFKPKRSAIFDKLDATDLVKHDIKTVVFISGYTESIVSSSSIYWTFHGELWGKTLRVFPQKTHMLSQYIFFIIWLGTAFDTAVETCGYHLFNLSTHAKPKGHWSRRVLTLISAWICNYMQNKVWGEINYQFQQFISYTVEVWKYIRIFISHFIMDVIPYASWY